MKIKVNGREHQLDIAAEVPLLWVLRDHLQLTGTKFGCGKGLCGACTVHVDGSPVRSCQTPLALAEGKEIMTIEGLSHDATHPVQVAWQNNNVPQCGYCQSGQIMSAVALLEQNPSPNDAEIDRAMAGNICRCGTYSRIRKAIKEAGSKKAEGQA